MHIRIKDGLSPCSGIGGHDRRDYIDEDMEVTLDLRQYAGYRVQEHIVMHNEDLKAVNTEADPERVYPPHWNDTIHSTRPVRY